MSAEMTVKEKSQQLVDYFYGETKHTLRDFKDAWAAAKSCAIICVDEIIKSQPYSPNDKGLWEHIDRGFEQAKEYWEQVKEEINKL